MRLLLLLLVACAIHAAESPTSDAASQDARLKTVLDRISASQTGVTTVRMPFVQEKHLAIMEEPLISEGVIDINRPLGAVRWQFTGKSVMLFTHGKIHRFNSEGVSEGSPDDPNLRPFQEQMQAFISGDWSSLQKAFLLTVPADGSPTLHMTPRSPQLAKYVTSIEIRFRTDFSAPQQMVMTATGGDQTIYRFKDPQAGIDLPASRFEKP